MVPALIARRRAGVLPWLLLAGLAASGCTNSLPLTTLDHDITRALRRGDLSRALTLSADGVSRSSGQARDAFGLRQAEVHLMRREFAEATAILTAPLAPGAGHDRNDAKRRVLSGYERLIQRRFEEAVLTLEDAVAHADQLGETAVALEAEPLLAQALYRLNRPADADRRLTAALARARATSDAHDDAVMLATLGMGQLTRARFDEALGYFERVLALTGLSGDLVYATALLNAGICHARLGEFDKAVAMQTQVVAAHESRSVPLYLVQALGELGNTYSLSGEPAKGLPFLERARSVAISAGLTADAALWTGNLAVAHIGLEHWDAARQLNDEAIRLKRAGGQTSLVHNVVNRGRIAAGQRRLAEARGEFNAALADAEAPPSARWMAHAGLADVLMAEGASEAALTEFDRALQVIEETRADLLLPEYRFSFLSSLIAFHHAYVEALVSMGQTERALEVADFSRARVLSERLGRPRADRLRAGELIRRARAGGATVISYWLAPRRSHAWIINNRSVTRVDLPAEAKIAALVGAHRQFIERSLGNPLSVARAPGDDLAAAVVEPVRRHLGPASRVIVIPDGALHGVNFETLPVGTPRHYWIDDVTITVAPSLALMDRPRRQVASRPPALLLIGDPVSTNDARARLAFAGPELDGILRSFPGTTPTVHRGAQAVPGAYLDGAPHQFSIVHFAAHATSSALSPLDSAIELSPDQQGRSKLYAREIAARRVDADLVTISACRGVGSRAYSGEGPVGLAWAFLGAGARRVIAGLWDVDDQSTATLMTALYTNLASGVPAPDALRAAKLAMIARGGNFAKPYYWAPLQVFAASAAP